MSVGTAHSLALFTTVQMRNKCSRPSTNVMIIAGISTTYPVLKHVHCVHASNARELGETEAT